MMILVSACLAGFPCRYDGCSKPDKRFVQLVKQGKAIPVCPEQMGGLPTPRSPAERKEGLVLNAAGNDVTENFERGANIILQLAKLYECPKAVLKARSPSCGTNYIYDGNFSGTLVKGNGVTAELLIKNGIEVQSENDFMFESNQL